MVNGLNPAIKGHLTGVDLALALHFAGLRCISEPDCRMYVELDDVVGAGRLGGGQPPNDFFGLGLPEWDGYERYPDMRRY